MIKLTRQQVYDRWDSLSVEMRGVLFSERNSDILWRTCEAEHIPEEKAATIVHVAGFVFLGFIHPEEVAGEIQSRTGLDQRIAKTIADALNLQIFTPLKPTLDNLYAPAVSTPLKIPAAMPIGSTLPAPIPVSMPPTQPTTGFHIPAPVAMPKPSAPPTPTGPSFAGAATEGKRPTPYTLHPTPSPAPAPAPFVLHKETGFAPIQPKTTTFRIEIPASMGGQGGQMAPARTTGAVPRQNDLVGLESGGNGKWPASPNLQRGEQMADKQSLGGVAPASLASSSLQRSGPFASQGGPASQDAARNKMMGAPARIELGKSFTENQPPKPVVSRIETPLPRVIQYSQFRVPKAIPDGGPVPLSAIGTKNLDRPIPPRPSLDIPLEKPTVVLKPPPLPPGK